MSAQPGAQLAMAPDPSSAPRCQVAASQLAPLVTEWPATEKANLEILTRRGAVAVAYSGCSMKILSNCQLIGRYAWNRITPVSDSFEIADEDELYAKLPIGAVGLEGELKRWGKLAVQTSVSGQLRLEGLQPSDIPVSGECAQATHVIGALSVGAFQMTRGGGDTIGAGADVVVASAGAKTSHSATVVRAAGQADTCGQATDSAPHPNCASPVQVFLWTIPARPPLATVEEGVQEPPPYTGPGDAPMSSVGDGVRNGVMVDLVSGRADSRWDVYVDDEVICSTPCTRMLDPSRPVLMRARPDRFGALRDEVSVPNLFPAAAESPQLQLLARPTEHGQYVTGITFTSLGGMAAVTGLMLSGVGCSGEPARRPELCGPGLITLAAGSVVTTGAVWLLLDSFPKAVVAPLRTVSAQR